MDGLINLNKPRGITSAKALYRVRGITGVRKSGHAGTLDPAADGVLLLCLGKATKLVETLMDQPKVYRATARLDVTSASLDADEALKPVDVAGVPERDGILAALPTFVGRIEQVPPQISAVKVGGRPAYKLARRGQRVALHARPAVIYWIRLIEYRWPEVSLELACGRGTYVRSLIRDLGASLGCGGCLISLTRRAIGPFRLNEAIGLQDLAQAQDPHGAVIPLETARTMAATVTLAPPPTADTLRAADV